MLLVTTYKGLTKKNLCSLLITMNKVLGFFDQPSLFALSNNEQPKPQLWEKKSAYFGNYLETLLILKFIYIFFCLNTSNKY